MTVALFMQISVNLRRKAYTNDKTLPLTIGRNVAHNALVSAKISIQKKNQVLINGAISNIPNIRGTPIFKSDCYANYQTRDSVMLVKEDD